MNELSEHTAPTLAHELIVHDDGPNSILLDSGRFSQAQRIANLMASSSLLPDHLALAGRKGNKQELPIATKIANCFRIVNQAFRWGLDPFAIIDCTYVIGGKLGYEGKLVAALVNSRAGLDGRLSATYMGEGANRTVIVTGKFANEPGPRTVDLRLADAQTDNQMWRKDPDQKLWYSGVVKWARRHCPEVVLGVLTDDDLERIRDSEKRPMFAIPVSDDTASSGGATADDLLEPTAAGKVPPKNRGKKAGKKKSEPAEQTINETNETTGPPPDSSEAEQHEPEPPELSPAFQDLDARINDCGSEVTYLSAKQQLTADKSSLTVNEYDFLEGAIEQGIAALSN